MAEVYYDKFVFEGDSSGARAAATQLQGTLGRLDNQFNKSTAALRLLEGGLSGATSKVGEAAGKVAGLAGMMANGGVFGLAIGAATLAVGGLAKAYDVLTEKSNSSAAGIKAHHRLMAEAIVDHQKKLAELQKQRDAVGKSSEQLTIEQAGGLVQETEAKLEKQRAILLESIRKRREITGRMSDPLLSGIPGGKAGLQALAAEQDAAIELQKRNLDETSQLLKIREEQYAAQQELINEQEAQAAKERAQKTSPSAGEITRDIENAMFREMVAMAEERFKAQEDAAKEAQKIQDDANKAAIKADEDTAAKRFDNFINYRQQMIEAHADAFEKMAMAQDEAEQRMLDNSATWTKTWQAGVTTGFDAAGQAGQMMFDAWMSGEDVFSKKFARNMLRSIGQTLIGKGIADTAASTATGLIYGNWSGYSAAAAEISLGTAMLAGNAALGGKTRQASPSGAAGGGSFGGGGVSTGDSDKGKGMLVINVQGAMSAAAAGREVSDAIAMAAQKGYL